MYTSELSVPINPATLRAKEEYKKLASVRIKLEDDLLNKKWPETLQCCTCTKHGIKTRYKSNTMLHIFTKTKRKGKPVIIWRHYCKKHTATYKPNHLAVGGKNF